MRYVAVNAAQGFCPPGWHIPSEAEWNILFAIYISSGFAGNALKVTGYSGFDALLTGIRFHNNIWKFPSIDPILRSILFWCSSIYCSFKIHKSSIYKRYSIMLGIEHYTRVISIYFPILSI